MKQGIHPEYRTVVFRDTSADFSFLTRSTLTSNETVTWEDGNEYPLIRVEISSASHPFFTGKQKLVDTAGRVERFQRRVAKTEQAKKEIAERQARRAAKDAAAEPPPARRAAKKAPAKKAAAKKAAPEAPAAEAPPTPAPESAPEAPAEG